MTPANNISLEKIQLGLSTPKKVTTLAVISVDFRSGIKRGNNRVRWLKKDTGFPNSEIASR